MLDSPFLLPKSDARKNEKTLDFSNPLKFKPFKAKRKNITYGKMILNKKRSPVFNSSPPSKDLGISIAKNGVFVK